MKKEREEQAKLEQVQSAANEEKDNKEMEEELALIKPWLVEIAMCDQLLSYLKKLNPESKSAEEEVAVDVSMLLCY